MLITLIKGLITRAGGVFIRVSDRVAGNRRFMGFGAFTAKITRFNIFLGIIPCGASGSH